MPCDVSVTLSQVDLAKFSHLYCIYSVYFTPFLFSFMCNLLNCSTRELRFVEGKKRWGFFFLSFFISRTRKQFFAAFVAE